MERDRSRSDLHSSDEITDGFDHRKQLLVQRLKGAEDQLHQIASYVTQSTSEGFKKDSLLSRMKNVFEYIGASLSLTHPSNYASILEDLLEVAKNAKSHEQSDTPSLETQILTAEKQYFNFGKNELLNIQHIIRSCYANPQRRNYPGIFSWGTIYSKDDYPEYFLERLNNEQPKSVELFNSAKLELYDTSTFRDKIGVGEIIDKQKYLDEIKHCRWYGPYKDEEDDYFLFYALNDSANNEFKVRLEIGFNFKRITFSYRFKSSYIAPGHIFKEEN